MSGHTPASAIARREFEFSSADFERVRLLIYRHAGIALSESKREMVYSRLARRLRATGAQSFADYLLRLEHGDRTEWEAFTNSLTTNLTSFFREEHHFPILAAHVTRPAAAAPLALWCCAASTGEEAYSMAITMAEAFRSFTPPVRILATDIDTAVLAHARAGVYERERLAKLSADRQRQFFVAEGGAESGRVRVRRELQDMISFRQVNLLEPQWPLRGPFDAIFCRNVMIYFDKDTQYRILSRFVRLLKPDGLLFTGHSESFFYAPDLFRLRERTVYQLARAGAA